MYGRKGEGERVSLVSYVQYVYLDNYSAVIFRITTKFSVRVSIASFVSGQLYAKVLLKLVFTA